jgi:hypothetical protein
MNDVACVMGQSSQGTPGMDKRESFRPRVAASEEGDLDRVRVAALGNITPQVLAEKGGQPNR